MYGAQGAPAPSSAAPVPSPRVLEGQAPRGPGVHTHTHSHFLLFSPIPTQTHTDTYTLRDAHTQMHHTSHTLTPASLCYTRTLTPVYTGTGPRARVHRHVYVHTPRHTQSHTHTEPPHTRSTHQTHVCMCRDRHTDALWTHKRAHTHRCAHIRSQTRVLTSPELPPWSEGHTKCVSSIQACAELAGLAHQGRVAWGCGQGRGWW